MSRLTCRKYFDRMMRLRDQLLPQQYFSPKPIITSANFWWHFFWQCHLARFWPKYCLNPFFIMLYNISYCWERSLESTLCTKHMQQNCSFQIDIAVWCNPQQDILNKGCVHVRQPSYSTRGEKVIHHFQMPSVTEGISRNRFYSPDPSQIYLGFHRLL